MLTDEQLAQIAIREIRSIFEPDYLRANRVGSVMAHGMVDDDTYMLFVGIKDSHELPDHKASEKGWTVYADIRINANSGEVISRDYLNE